MKKILFFVILIVTLVSCDEDNKIKEVENPNEITTLEIQKLPKDTVVISIDVDKLYIFDDSTRVIKKITNINTEEYIRIDPLRFFLILTLIIISIILAAVFSSN